MPIIDRLDRRIVQGDGSRAPRGFLPRMGWFAAIWLASTAAFIAVASLLHLLIPK